MGRRAQLRLRHASRVVSFPEDVLCDPSPFLSLFPGQEAPAGRSKDRGRWQIWRQGLKQGCRCFPNSDGGQSKSLILHLLLKRGCCGAQPCAYWGKKCPHVQMKMAESTSAVVPGPSASPHKQHNLSALQTFIFWVEWRAENSQDSKAEKLTGCLES